MAGRERSIVLVVAILTGAFCTAIAVLPIDTSANTLYVGGTSTGNHSSIQNAIDAASLGDTIYVYSGMYVEQVTISKPLTIQGERKETTIVDGNGIGDVFTLTIGSVNISGFTIKNSGATPNDAGIRLSQVRECRITNNNVSSNQRGIVLVGSRSNTIEDNDVASNQRIGIDLNSSHDNIISGNFILSDAQGIGLSYSNGNLVTNNTIQNNRYGIVFWESDRNRILNNNISFNYIYGIDILSSDNNTIAGNIISHNKYSIELIWSEFNHVFHNSFVDNVYRALDHSDTNQWHNGYPSGGNYWSDNVGNDLKSGPNQDREGRDGIGDESYGIFDSPGGLRINEDRYPLMKPFGYPAEEPERSFPWIEAATLTVIAVVLLSVALLYSKRRGRRTRMVQSEVRPGPRGGRRKVQGKDRDG